MGAIAVPKQDKSKHVAHARKIKDETEAELGAYADGGPAVVIARPEWDGMTKPVEELDDDELEGEITSVVLHVAPSA
jgi:hypothetical protein